MIRHGDLVYFIDSHTRLTDFTMCRANIKSIYKHLQTVRLEVLRWKPSYIEILIKKAHCCYRLEQLNTYNTIIRCIFCNSSMTTIPCGRLYVEKVEQEHIKELFRKFKKIQLCL